MITKAANEGDIQGVSICKNGPKLTHLLFADDSLVFCRSTEAKCHHLLHILSVYERASGQQVNRAKTNLFFSKSTPHEMQVHIKDALGVAVVQQYDKYLGLPSFVGKTRRQVLIISSSRFGKSSKDGKENCSHKWEEKY